MTSAAPEPERDRGPAAGRLGPLLGSVGPATPGGGVAPTPLWFQIKERLRRSIAGGTLAAGDRLPTEHELMAMSGVSRTTVRAALQALENEGLVERVRGRGTFVRATPVHQPASQLAGFHEDMVRRGHSPSTRTLTSRLEAPPSEIASRLGLSDPPVLFVERLLLADAAPIAFQRSYIPQWVLGGGEPFSTQELDGTSLYDLMDQRTSSRPFAAEQIIEATVATDEFASLLDVEPGAPLLRAERLSLDRFGSPVEVVTIHYRADRYRFVVGLGPLAPEGARR
jgi:GntR family transcriptional regulator